MFCINTNNLTLSRPQLGLQLLISHQVLKRNFLFVDASNNWATHSWIRLQELRDAVHTVDMVANLIATWLLEGLPGYRIDGGNLHVHLHLTINALFRPSARVYRPTT